MAKFPQSYFFIGIFIGIFICSLAGYCISKKARFHQFNRFFYAIDPETNYYPTPDELLITASRKVAKNQTLVLIGGSSVFRGVGQNGFELWSKDLQKILGDNFKVINYANNSASFPSFAGVVFRTLVEQYPRIIFVSTCSNNNGPMDGVQVYKYFFWDAYYKNLFHPSNLELKKIKKLRNDELQNEGDVELHLSAFLNSIFYFKNLWNWFSYHFCFTVWNNIVSHSAFKPRKYFKDEILDFKKIYSKYKKDTTAFKNVTEMLSKAYLNINDNTADNYYNNAQLFDDKYRSQILCVMSEINPRYLSGLTRDSRKKYETDLKQGYHILKSLGYNVIYLQKISENDFGDLLHLLSSGGKKIANQIASEVQLIAKKNQFLNSENNSFPRYHTRQAVLFPENFHHFALNDFFDLNDGNTHFYKKEQLIL